MDKMDMYNNIQNAAEYYQKGDLQKAEDVCRKILQKQPNNSYVFNFLGAIYYARRDFDSALRFFRKSLLLNPNFAEAYNNLGNVLKEKDQVDEAIACYEKAIQRNSTFAIAHNGLGVALQEKGRIDDAIGYFQRALQINPIYVEALNNMGNAFRDKGFCDEAIDIFQRGLRINPNNADIYNNLGTVFRDKGLFDEAIVYFQKSLQMNPKFFNAYYNLGNVFEEKSQYENAIICYQKAIQINPKRAEVYNNLGNAYEGKGHLDEAMTCYQDALRVNPDYMDAYNNMGNIAKARGKVDEAELYYRRCLQAKPNHSVCFSNLLLTMNYNFRHSAQTVFHEHLKYVKIIAEPLISAIAPHMNERISDRRLRIGYISPDFRRHSVNYFIEPVLASHKHDFFEVFCYSDVGNPDSVTRRLQNYADRWQRIVGISDERVSELIRKDAIDILIDLAGHTGNNRMLVFARKPAPIQVNWLGYPNTTGLATVDYRLVDRYTDPPGLTDPFYTEKMIRLPDCFLCYQPGDVSPVVGPLPAISTGHITFGSFNYFPKISLGIIELWTQILKAVPNAHMILKAKSLSDDATRRHVMQMFMQRGIDIERIKLLSFEPSFKGHLEIYNRIDISLDTFPYHGTTTTCEALWMGVPVVTLSGNTHVSRVGVSLLSNVGLHELIAETPDDYVKIAKNLSDNLEKLQNLRGGLRPVMECSPLLDRERFICALESCYQTMWEQWCNSPKHRMQS
ncbi:MAG: tetratricopeptide repeat protein [Thermodesulfovibrionales bacterium]|nr:tetratricopeptide repeat protein [Thermodesulfovibrionales bacterium]